MMCIWATMYTWRTASWRVVDTIRANTYYNGEDGIKIVIESNERYVL